MPIWLTLLDVGVLWLASELVYFLIKIIKSLFK